jgi:integrase
VLLALNLGLRVGELCNLTWEDLDFQNRLLPVTAKPDWPPKSYQERSLELNAPTLAWLRQERARDASRLSPCVFPVRQRPKPGSRIGGMLVTRLSRLMRKLGIADGGFHLLRHSFASYQMMADADPKTLQEALGHSQQALPSQRHHPAGALWEAAQSWARKRDRARPGAPTAAKGPPVTKNRHKIATQGSVTGVSSSQVLEMPSVPRGIRTPVAAVKGRCPRPG